MLKLKDPIVLSFKETCGEGVLIVCMFSEVHVSNVAKSFAEAGNHYL